MIPVSTRKAVVDPTRRSQNGQRKNRLRQRVFDLHGANRVYCGVNIAKLGKYTLDHLQPRSRGGDNGIKNLRPACLLCNQSKRDRTPEEWAADILRVAQRPRGRFLAAAVAVVGIVMFWR